MMLTAPSRPAYHHPTTLPPLPGSQLSLGTRRVDLIAAKPASHPGRVRPGADIQRASDTIFTAFKTSTEEAVKEPEEEEERLDRGGEDQKENRHLSAKSLGLLIQSRKPTDSGDIFESTSLSDAGSSPHKIQKQNPETKWVSGLGPG